MQIRLLMLLLLYAGMLRAQIDTRIYPVPTPPQKQSAPSERWPGAPLSGFLTDTLGSALKEGLETSLSVSETATNQILNLNTNDYPLDELSRITGTVSLHHDWSRASVLTQYAGGSDFYVKNSYLSRQFHEFSASEVFKTPGWNLLLGQHFSYLPQSSFGFNPAYFIGNGVSSVGEQGTVPGVDVFLPNNVIERMISTDASAQRLFGSRSKVTFDGSFNDLHYSGVPPGIFLINSEGFTAGTEYSFALDRSSAIGAGYSFNQGRGLGSGGLVQTHAVIATYQYKLGDRLMLNVAGGPEFTTFNAGGTGENLGAATTLRANADYHLRQTILGISYYRGTNPGVGYFLASKNNDIRGFLGYDFGRSLHALLSVGHGQNDTVGMPRLNLAQQVTSTYVSVNVERTLSSMFSAYVGYTLQTQDTNAGGCSGIACATLPITHSGTIGIRFHIHPLTLRP